MSQKLITVRRAEVLLRKKLGVRTFVYLERDGVLVSDSLNKQIERRIIKRILKELENLEWFTKYKDEIEFVSIRVKEYTLLSNIVGLNLNIVYKKGIIMKIKKEELIEMVKNFTLDIGTKLFMFSIKAKNKELLIWDEEIEGDLFYYLRVDRGDYHYYIRTFYTQLPYLLNDLIQDEEVEVKVIRVLVLKELRRDRL